MHRSLHRQVTSSCAPNGMPSAIARRLSSSNSALMFASLIFFAALCCHPCRSAVLDLLPSSRPPPFRLPFFPVIPTGAPPFVFLPFLSSRPKRPLSVFL